jgi:hypothetical protein
VVVAGTVCAYPEHTSMTILRGHFAMMLVVTGRPGRPQIGVGPRVFWVDVTGHPKARSCAGLVVLVDAEVVAAGEQ